MQVIKRSKRGKREADGSDTITYCLLYGTTSPVCQGGDGEGWFREDGLSEPGEGKVTLLVSPAPLV